MTFAVTDEQIETLCNRLQEHGSTVTTDGSGKRLFLVLSDVLDVDQEPRSLLIAYENGGAAYVEIGKRVSVFRLLELGFGPMLSPTLADVVTRLGKAMATRLQRKSGTSLPMLGAPRGHEEE